MPLTGFILNVPVPSRTYDFLTPFHINPLSPSIVALKPNAVEKLPFAHVAPFAANEPIPDAVAYLPDA